MANLQLNGVLIDKGSTQQVTEQFKKREFILDISEDKNGTTYTNYARLQVTQNKCDVLDGYNVGDAVLVSFNVRGNRYEKNGEVKYITNLEAWRIEKTGIASNEVHLYDNNVTGSKKNDTSDDLPF